MEYNTTRNKLLLPEYGRNIQKMVKHLLTIEDREKRNQQAQTVITVMGNLNPHLRDVSDFKHKLWDHLAIISDFELDIDYPYDVPTPETFSKKPKKVAYNQGNTIFRHYGKTLEMMIKKAAQYPEGEGKSLLIEALANHMKKSYLTWNKDSVEDFVILNDMREIAPEITIPEGLKLADIKISPAQIIPNGRDRDNRKKKKATTKRRR